ncbi:hypothetical protein L211DRAFT_870291 [Terfezia boudieri ATCC MYA-4762]|uniref:F-box domain-containing protein n=1 Tax=Terfezia boudieri ATCC MYA-4762 TaxID=1051890 RepID=A0A3N4LDC2_9PEZI|nr:hypothetical protein L211DRAFT_870291 [Terfezia boudieri ATCC MYA-4762]
MPRPTSIQHLPTEVLDIIISLLEGRVGLYAVVCRRWQKVVERYSFKSISIRSIHLEELRAIFGRNPHHLHRRASLKHISLEVILPTYSARACAKFERPEDMMANNSVFTEAIHTFFGILHDWEVHGLQNGGGGYTLCNIGFSLSISSPMDDGCNRTDISLHKGKIPRQPPTSRDCGDTRFAHSYIQLIGLKERPLPILSCIYFFRAQFFRRQLAGASAAALACALPKLEDLELSLSDHEWMFPLTRQKNRYDFGQALHTLCLNNTALQSFSLSYVMEEPTDHGFCIPNALPDNSPDTDTLSQALHALSQSSTLTYVYLDDIVVSEELFWPKNIPSTSGRPFWPALKEFAVYANPTTPTGQWYFERNIHYPPTTSDGQDDFPITPSFFPDEHADQEDEWLSTDSEPDPLDEYRNLRLCGQARINKFRRRLSPELFNPLVFAFARAVQRMPKLNLFNFSMNSGGSPVFQAEWVRDGIVSSQWDGYEGEEEEQEIGKQRWTFIIIEETEWEVPGGLMAILNDTLGERGLFRFRTVDRDVIQ